MRDPGGTGVAARARIRAQNSTEGVGECDGIRSDFLQRYFPGLLVRSRAAEVEAEAEEQPLTWAMLDPDKRARASVRAAVHWTLP